MARDITDEERNILAKLEAQGAFKRPRVGELIVGVSGPLGGGIGDWPANVQDKVYEALARFNADKGEDFYITKSWCDHDVDTGWYIRVLVSNVRPN